jgi:hypothetical protein
MNAREREAEREALAHYTTGNSQKALELNKELEE